MSPHWPMLFRSTSQTFEQNRRAVPDLDFQVLRSDKHSWIEYTNKHFDYTSIIRAILNWPQIFLIQSRIHEDNWIITYISIDRTMIGPSSDDIEYFFYYLHSRCMPESWFVGTRKYLLEEGPVPKTKNIISASLEWKSESLDSKKRVDFHLFLFLTLCDLVFLRGIE